MKKSILKCISIIAMIIILLSITGISNAFSVGFKLESSSKLEVGKTVEVILKIDSIDAGNGIDAIAVTLDYDRNIFENVTRSSIQTLNDWYIGAIASDTGIFTIQRDEKVNAISEILKVTLKIKDTATLNSTTIKLKDISASGGAVEDGGTGDIIIPDASITIGKSVDDIEEPVTNEIKNDLVNVTNTTNNIVVNTIKNPTTNTNDNTNIVLSNNTNIVSSNGSSTGKLPQTGEKDIIVTIGIVFVVIVAIIAYIKYRDLNIK